MVIRGSMTLGNYVTINGYLWMLMNPLRQIGWRINDIQRFTTSVEKIYATYSEGYDMARSVGVPFIGAGWANDIAKIRTFMKQNSDYYFTNVKELEKFLFS